MSNASDTEAAQATADVRSSDCDCDYDVIVIGGAFSGASTALLLRRLLPSSRILMVEQSPAFSHKVGEATVELSALFLVKVLGLWDELSREHLPKHGLRYWFTDGPNRRLDEMSEVGPSAPPDLPSFQLDRSKLDERLLALAQEEGAEVVRPARVIRFEPGWPKSTVEIESEGREGEAGEKRELSARWVVDASGRHAFIGRRLRLLKRTERHPIAATWARWEGVKDLDGTAVLGTDPREPRLPPVAASRRLATNHFCGRGWWCWVIPLAGGKTSIGRVYHKELVGKAEQGTAEEGAAEEGTAAERYFRFVRSHPGLRELVADAVPCEDDCHSYSHLPYRATRYMDRGWALVGDAGSFLDPYYSPGLDHAAISIYATVSLLEADLGGELDESELGRRIEVHNADFARSYTRWIEALYVGKYELFGDAELTACAFLVDTAFYYLGVVSPAYRQIDALRLPVFGPAVPQARMAHLLVRTFNRRLQRLAYLRRKTGLYGRRNVGWRLEQAPFRRGLGALPPLLRGLCLWGRIEARQLAATLNPLRRFSGPRGLESRTTEKARVG